MVTRVLVTGGCGMLGLNLVQRLHADGYGVHSLDVREPAEPLPGVRYTVGDVRDPDAVARAMAGVDAAVHTAAALPSYPEPEIRSVIVDGTRTVLGAAVAAGLERVVHISSTAVYGLPDVVPTTEDHPRAPVDAYSRAKAGAEEVAEEFRAAGLCVPILRPKTFLGPGRLGLFAMLFEWADEGRNFPVIGRGDVRIQMLAIEDLIDAVAVALTAPAVVANDTFNIAAADFGTLREDFQAVLDAAGHGRRIVPVPAGAAVAVLDLLRRARLSPVYGRLVHKLRADSYVSVTKAHERLDFRSRRSNRDAILATYRWWRDRAATDAAAGTGPAAPAGRTSREPWRQGVLSLAKVFF
ncbi:NAD-dependent epimerase/dehydratase family protein [Polymorphospora rubra]|uniref:Epimerase n=1 Tax=Polymorphospora rubra TaxID=338584 RepID=A0A810N880_9ACTN|nr:NAD-dependent epimerase/dehydratase family protein [Polymorphospora rubra]BCJ68664.1 epimerase [Polymorphospora rubra]